ncbi:hypothetical protein AAE478_008463 [Parahypoxylon ruwenzoriense]
MPDNKETFDAQDWDYKRESFGLSALPKVVAPAPSAETFKSSTTVTTDICFTHQPHALSVDFQCHRSDGRVSPRSVASRISSTSVISLSPSLFPLPPTGGTPTATPPTSPITSPSTRPRSRSASRATSSHSNSSAWFCPPSPPPSTPLPPLPKLSPAKLAASRLRTLDLATSRPEPSGIIILRPSSNCSNNDYLNIDNRASLRESAVDPDVLPTPPRSSLPPPYSPGLLAASERPESTDGSSTRVDSTVPLVSYHTVTAGHNSFQSQSSAVAYGLAKGSGDDMEAQLDPGRKRRRKIAVIAGAVSVTALGIIAGVSVGVYFAMSNSKASE